MCLIIVLNLGGMGLNSICLLKQQCIDDSFLGSVNNIEKAVMAKITCLAVMVLRRRFKGLQTE